MREVMQLVDLKLVFGITKNQTTRRVVFFEKGAQTHLTPK